MFVSIRRPSCGVVIVLCRPLPRSLSRQEMLTGIVVQKQAGWRSVMFLVKKSGTHIDPSTTLVRLETLIGKPLDVVANGRFRPVLDCYPLARLNRFVPCREPFYLC